MDEKITAKRPPTIPNLIIGSAIDNNQLINNLQKNNLVLNNSRRCSTGLLFEGPATCKFDQTRLNNKQLSSFRQLKKLSRLQNLHYESYGVGLNGLNICSNQNVYNQNLKLGLLLRSSLPATPISTPIHGEFKPFTEKLLLDRIDRLSRTPPMQRKPQWNSSVKVYDGCIKRNSESNTSLNRHLDKHLVPRTKLKDDDFNALSKFNPLDNLNENDINVDKNNMNNIYRNFTNKNDLNNNTKRNSERM